MSTRNASPLSAVVLGAAAGVVGTGLMTAWQEYSAKLQDDGDESSTEDEEPKDPWEEAPAPAIVAKRVIEGVFQKEVSADRIGQLTNVMHWGYGTTWGTAFGLIAGTRGRSGLGSGLVFGTGVWLASYAQLVPMGLYEPPWEYEPKDLAMDLSYHLVYGAGVATGYAALTSASS